MMLSSGFATLARVASTKQGASPVTDEVWEPDISYSCALYIFMMLHDASFLNAAAMLLLLRLQNLIDNNYYSY